MRVSFFSNLVKYVGIGAIVLAGVATSPVAKAQNKNNVYNSVCDEFVSSTKVTSKGTVDVGKLGDVPNPKIKIAGEKKLATIVVDLAKNILYHYNDEGKVQNAYLVASGKSKTPTDTGVRMVTHIEFYPYRNAPVASRRRRHPQDYGPRIICLETIDPKTGVKGVTGEFIHGNNNVNSLGKYASLGCIRMDNEVIKELAKKVKRGAIVVIKK